MSRIAYLVSYDVRVDVRRDAVAQDVALLRARLGGRVARFSPRARGWLLALRLAVLARGADVLHVFHPSLLAPPLLGRVGKPVVFSVGGGIAMAGRARPPAGARRYARIVVSGERDARALASAGLTNAAIIAPGVDLARFVPSEPPALSADAPFRLLCASAPWNERQFAGKGIDGLLDAAAQVASLRIDFLWRGVEYPAMMARVRARGLEGRVSVFDGYADVAAALRGAHAAVVLADDPELVKPYPHSLIEALASARPVLISRAIAMSDWVSARGLGVVVEGVDAGSIAVALRPLRRDYARLQAACAGFPRQAFDRSRWLDDHAALYRLVLGA